MTSLSSQVQREFFDLPSSEKLDVEGSEHRTRFFGSRTVGWSQLLQSDRVLIVSEAGMGKTFECQQARRALWNVGEAAFFIELADLASGPLQDRLSRDEIKRFESWEVAQTERAVFFLDSIDELSLTPTSFATALKSVARSLGDNLGRACIVLTTRPIAVDRELIHEHLPVPETMVVDAEEAFANAAMRIKKKSDSSGPPVWRYVALAPLSDAQMREFAVQRKIENIDALLEAIQARNAEEFAKRPLDFFELCSNWREYGYIQPHRTQLDESIDVKLRDRKDRRARQSLPHAHAREGAARLALAMLLSRKLTIWHGADEDIEGRAVALDPNLVLGDWSADEVSALVEMALWGFANYGRVRFHHRSAIEFLAAERLQALRARGLPDRTLRGLLSASGPDGKVLIRPSMQAVAAWLARDVMPVRKMLLEYQPSILLHFGDPESLDITMRCEALRRYVAIYGKGGWRGQSVPSLQVKRFASKDLGEVIAELWLSGISNPEVRETLLELIGEAKIERNAEIAHGAATDSLGEVSDRLHGLEALAKLDDARLPGLLDDIASPTSDWPLSIVSRVIMGLFPAHMSTRQLIGCLGRLESRKRRYGSIFAHLPSVLSKAKLSSDQIYDIRTGLYALVAADLSWSESLYRVQARRRDLVPALLAICVREIGSRKFERRLAEAIALGSILGNADHDSEEDWRELRGLLAEAPENFREVVFWEITRVVSEVSSAKDRSAGPRSFLVQHQTAFRVGTIDGGWLIRAVADTNRALDDRELALEIAIEVAQLDGDFPQWMSKLQAEVGDAQSLLNRLEGYRDRVENPPPEPDWIKENAERQEKNRLKRESDLESWREFHRELLHETAANFSPSKVGNTLLNLWRAMENDHSDLSRPGWNRGFIERVFDKSMADRFRDAFAQAWRSGEPSLRSERPEDEKNSYLRSWRIGLAGVYAEAEDPQWASKLKEEEARLACRFALIDLNRLPRWVDDLIAEHPDAVDAIIGYELAHDLREADNSHVMLLQYLRSASPETAAHFVPCIRTWLNEVWAGKGVKPKSEKLKNAIIYLLRYGNASDHALVRSAAVKALEGELTQGDRSIWLAVLGGVDAESFVSHLEALATVTAPEKESVMVCLIGELFGHQASLHVEALVGRPELLLRVLRIANQHVRPEDDEVHDGAFSVNRRDNAEYARSALFAALMDAKGPEAWRIKLSFAEEPGAARYRDRVKAIAEEKLASELDSFRLTEKEITRFEKDFQFSPKSRREMAALLQARLDDLDDVLHQDGSPRELWAANGQERLLRREIARTLRHLAGEGYVTVEEAVTADEKEADIRLISKAAALEAVIELKVGENGYTIADFESALRGQLVAKYMAPEDRRVGALVISWAGKKVWRDPLSRKQVKFDELISRLNAYAQELVEGLGDDAFLTVRGLKLAPRDF